MLILSDSGILLRLVNPADPLHAIIDAVVKVIQSRGDTLAFSPPLIVEKAQIERIFSTVGEALKSLP